MSIHRYSRDLPNGWRVRLDLLPYNENLSGTVVEEPPYGVINIGEQSSEFDELPFGLQKPQTLKLELDWEGLSPTVRSIISTARQSTLLGEYRNTWMLFTDRGTNGATWSLEFIGVEDNIDALELEPNDSGYTYNAELVDAAYYTMKTLTGYQMFNGYDPEEATPFREIFDSLQVGSGGLPTDNQTAIIISLPTSFFGETSSLFAFASSFNHVMSWMSEIIGNNFNAFNARITDAFTNPIAGTFDIDDDLPEMIDTAARMYEQDPNEPRKAGSALTKSTAYLTTHISETNNSSNAYSTAIGGLASRTDKLGWGRDDVSAWDVFKRLAETLGVKLSYSFAYDNTTYTSPARPFVTVKWNVRRIASPITASNTTDAADYTVDLRTALSKPSISIRGNNVLKGEARIEGFSDDDITEWVVVTGGTESSRSINVEPMLLNIPTYKDRVVSGVGWVRNGYIQTNNVVTKYGTTDQLLKAHEDTDVFWGPGSTQKISVSTSASADLPQITNRALYKLSLAERQSRSCLPYALVKFYSTVFAEEDSASIELEYDLRNSAGFLPSALGCRKTFTNGAADLFTSLPWSRAICTSIVTDWTAGTTKARYYLMEAP